MLKTSEPLRMGAQAYGAPLLHLLTGPIDNMLFSHLERHGFLFLSF
jgi:hypothetical protein